MYNGNDKTQLMRMISTVSQHIGRPFRDPYLTIHPSAPSTVPYDR